ncbi:hypothetical protein RhiirA5_437980 [Rhizophagus irregularis]|uniref:Uncharacterized protein n=1 Tax=Rhizophagus irregularis TaxID=588596 RepID=A0A2N0NJS6_9GLOM|nr:hypothetical protein RhiirA5_437980 [Rhizophagus irregularis]
MYYENWADLDKIINFKLNLEEYEDVWTRYFLLNSLKINKESKPSGKQNSFKTFGKIKKGLDGNETGKLTLLAKIRSLLRKLEN